MNLKHEERTGTVEECAGLMWEITGKNYEKCSHPTIIEQVLASLIHKKKLVSIHNDEHRFAKTNLIKFSKKTLQFEKPFDWSDNHSTLVIIFQNKKMVWNFFRVRALAASYETLYTTVPAEMYRMQRRTDQRTEAPTGSKAVFRLNNEEYRVATIRDISAGGMSIYSNRLNRKLTENCELHNISLVIPETYVSSMASKGQRSFPIISKGRVAHRKNDGITGKYLIGISFDPSEETKEQLTGYVKKRQELLAFGA